MTIGDLLSNIKLGEDEFAEYKFNEDIEQDFELILEENKRYFRFGFRMKRLNDKFESRFSDLKEVKGILGDFRRIQTTLEDLDRRELAGSVTSKAQARIKLSNITKKFNEVIKVIRERETANLIGSKIQLQNYLGNILGTIYKAAKYLQPIAEFNEKQIPLRRSIPVTISSSFKREIDLLDKNKDTPKDKEERD